jgi:hypothetical protein
MMTTRCNEEWPEITQGVYRGLEDALEIVGGLEGRISERATDAHIALAWASDRILEQIRALYDEAEAELRTQRRGRN